MDKQYINEVSWGKIFEFLQKQNNIYIKSQKSCRNFMEAMFWMTRTGAQWRELPEKYGKWNSVFYRFNEWSKKNIWHLFHQFCIQDPDMEYIAIDSTIVRAHACSAGYKKNGNEALGRSKGGFTSKIHAITDALGNPLKFVLTGGQVNDITQASALLQGIENAYVLGDKGYVSNDLHVQILGQNSVPVIPSRSNSKNPNDYDKHIYEERHVIECFFSKIKHFRRIFSRFDKSSRNFLSFLSFTGALIWLR
jgi:transposase